MNELLAEPFLVRALAVGLLLAASASYLGVFVVQRRLSFLSDGLAHCAFAGVALGLYLDQEPMALALPYAIAASVAIVWLQQRTRAAQDAMIGVVFATSVALGIVLLSLRPTFSTDAFAYLFGSILAVSRADVAWAAGLLALVLLSTRFWGAWAYATFDAELAQVDGVPVNVHEYVLGVMVAVTVVVSMKLVGMVLALAFLVIPAASARLLARSLGAMTVVAMTIGLVAVIIGLDMSYRTDAPTGASIVLAQAALFAFIGAMATVRAMLARSGFRKT